MAEDFLVKTKRNRFDVRGHSGKKPVFVVKEATNADGLPLQVALNQRSGLQVWSPRDREYVTDKRASNLQLKFEVKIDTAMKFVAKVALSAGYFAYGDLFRRNVKHSDFRTIMNFQPSNPSGHEDVEARVDDRFSESTVEDRFGVFVGILGEYIGTIHVPAVMGAFPKDGEHQMGHVIQLLRPGLTRVSMKQALESFLKAVETTNANKEVDTQP